MCWDWGKNLASATGFSLLEQSSHSTLALSIQVHTSPNAVLMKPFITSSLLSWICITFHSHTHQASCFFFLPHKRVWERCVLPPSLPCRCTSSILVFPRFVIALVGTSPASPLHVFFLKQPDLKRWGLPFTLNPPIQYMGVLQLRFSRSARMRLLYSVGWLKKHVKHSPQKDHPLVCEPKNRES